MTCFDYFQPYFQIKQNLHYKWETIKFDDLFWNQENSILKLFHPIFYINKHSASKIKTRQNIYMTKMVNSDKVFMFSDDKGERM